MSQSTVQKTLKEHILKPHKVDYWCGKSTDPEFEAKMLNVIGLYLNPDKNAMVLSVDEKTQIQALDRSQPELPLRSGNAKRLTATYKRNGTVSLIAALAVHHGEITAQTIEKNNHENFLKFLKKLYRKYPKKHLHIIADNLTVHKHKKINDWISTKKRITMHFTPTSNILTHNPVAQLEYRTNTSDAQRYILGGKIDYTLPFLRDMTVTLNLGYDYFSTDGYDASDTLGSWTYREPQNQVKSYNQTKENELLDFYLNYKKDIDAIDSKIDITGGYSYQHFYNEGDNANRPWVQTDGEYVGSDTTVYKNEYYLISFFGRLNYTFKDRYLITATLRNDGSSRFAKDNRWGLFPAFAFAWKINEESFLRNVDAIDELKLRAGWGQTGQQDIGDTYYPYIPTYTISQQGAFYQFGNSFTPTLRPDPYDAGIQWETTTTQNIGLDISLLSGRVSGSVDLYKRVTDDLLNEIPIAAGINFSNFLTTNVGSLENKGVEIGLSIVPISKVDFTWEISGNLTYNQNEITKLTLVDDPSYPGYTTGDIAGGVGNTVQINQVGYPANTFYLFSQVYNQDGMPIEGLYVDKTGEGGNVSGNDLNKYYLQNPAPDYLIGISSRLNYKNIDFSFSGRINLDNYVYNNNASNMALYQNLYNQSGYTANILTDVEKTQFMTAQYWSDFYLENASFFRMDYITLGYSFDKLFTEKLNGRIALTVQNAFVITNYTGLDPEVDGGIDNNIYPRPRTYMLGVNLNF
jgi:TonB-linked SusC/RagA family outer membrane protein